MIEETEIKFNGIIAPESSYVPQNVKNIINHMARLDFQINYKEGGTLISMHHSYLDYLEDNNLIEPPRV